MPNDVSLADVSDVAGEPEAVFGVEVFFTDETQPVAINIIPNTKKANAKYDFFIYLYN